MNQKSPLRVAWLVLFLASGSRGLEGVQMIMPNGSRVVVEAEDIAVDIADAAGRALPEDEGELKNLLNWAISHSNPEQLKRQAASGASKEAIERRQQVQEAIKRMQEEPTEAELMIEAIEILGNDTSDDGAKLGALQALHILLEPIDNANGELNNLHKLGGIEVIASLLDDNSSDAVRAAAAFALGIAASSNEPFIVELTQRGGDDVMIQLLEIAEMDDPGAAAKGLYGMSKLLNSADQRATFYGSGGMERMQGALANASLSDRVHRKISSLFGDLAMRGEEFVEQIWKLPEKGKEVVRSLGPHLSPRDWDLSERAMHALQNIASAPGAAHAFEGSDVEKRLAKLEGEAKGENADQNDSYLSDLEALAHRTRSKIQELVGSAAGHHTEDGEL